MEERSFDEAIALYYREWVLMRITAFDEHRRPARGLIITHSPDRAAISEVFKKQPPTAKDAPYQPYYVFKAYPRVRPGETFEQAEERFDAERAAVLETRRALGQR